MIAGQGMRPKRCEVFDISWVALRCESGSFAQRERPVELLRGKSQDVVAVCPCHGKDKIGSSGYPRHKLPRGEAGCIPTQVLEDARGGGFNRTPRHRVSTRTRCCEVLGVGSSPVCDSKSFRRGRTTNVSCTDEKYVQSMLLSSEFRIP